MVAPGKRVNGEQAAVAISGMDREQLICELLHLPTARVRMDFTEEYLGAMPLEALRHLLWAAMTKLALAG